MYVYDVYVRMQNITIVEAPSDGYCMQFAMLKGWQKVKQPTLPHWPVPNKKQRWVTIYLDPICSLNKKNTV